VLPPPADASLCDTRFPLLDVSRLPDSDARVPQGPAPEYSPQYMARITAWAQVVMRVVLERA
jgi:hypothetical protein